jgi:hypothetical protein
MPDIDVTFGHPDQPPTALQQGTTRAHTANQINWNFATLDSNVQAAEIVFDDPNDLFFPARNGAHSNKCQIPLVNGSGSMHGTVPKPKSAGVRMKKYTVKAYDGAGAEILTYRLDPDVVTVDP